MNINDNMNNNINYINNNNINNNNITNNTNTKNLYITNSSNKSSVSFIHTRSNLLTPRLPLPSIYNNL